MQQKVTQSHTQKVVTLKCLFEHLCCLCDVNIFILCRLSVMPA